MGDSGEALCVSREELEQAVRNFHWGKIPHVAKIDN